MGMMDGKIAVVTGAGGALGTEFALAIAREGAAVAATDINLEGATRTADTIVETGGSAIAVPADVTRAADFEAVFRAAEDRLGPVNVLINVAGIFPRSYLVDMSEDEWDQVIAVNLRSVFLGTQIALRRMLPRKSGTIVSVASGIGMRGSAQGSHYAASKAGIIAFTRSIAMETKDSGVRINCVGPGATDTPLWRVGKTQPEVEALLASGRIHQPGDFARVVTFLASDASWPLSGEFIAREI